MWYDKNKNGSKILDLGGMWYPWLDGWTFLPEKTDGGDLSVVSKSSKAAESDSAPALSQRVFSPLSPGWGQVGLLEEASRAGQEKNGLVLVILIVGVGGQLAEMIKIFSSQPKYFPEKSGRVGALRRTAHCSSTVEWDRIACRQCSSNVSWGGRWSRMISSSSLSPSPFIFS